MAFQERQPFFAFLQGAAAGVALEEVAPAENCILDERVPAAREDDFLSFNGFSAVLPLTRDAWFQQHVNYGESKVACRASRAAISATFDAINGSNRLNLQPDWDVVRIETVKGLCDRQKTEVEDRAHAQDLVQSYLAARSGGAPMEPFDRARLEKWLNEVNAGADRRPAFVTPFADIETLLARSDWANRLRDALGLGHIRGTSDRPTAVVLLQYNLKRVHDAHLKRPAWAASPTVLDDVPTAAPNSCFFPAPKSVSSGGYGFTVDLDPANAVFCQEFLHAHISYTLDDFHRVGEVTTDISPAQIAQARRSHRGLLAGDLRHLKDLPARP